MFALIAYNGACTSASVNTDLAAAVDVQFTARNNHYTFTEQYQLIAAAVYGKTVTEVNVTSPTLASYTKLNIWPVGSDTVTQSPPRIDYYTQYPIMIPQNEEIQFQATDTAADTVTTFSWLATNDWSQNIPRGIGPIPSFRTRITATLANVVNKWSPLIQVTFETSPRGGTYAVVGAQFFAANTQAVRIVFPRQRAYQGRYLRPGALCANALGDLYSEPAPWQSYFWGEWGRFSTFELPQLEVWGNTTSTGQLVGILDLVRVSDDANVVY